MNWISEMNPSFPQRPSAPRLRSGTRILAPYCPSTLRLRSGYHFAQGPALDLIISFVLVVQVFPSS